MKINKEITGSIDQQTRCSHYHSPLDIVALQFYCCKKWYPCHSCHDEHESHSIESWPKKEYQTHAVLCGQCRETLSISEYLNVSACPHCGEEFNPGCSLHKSIYFEE